MAAENGHVDIVRYLFTKGADIHIKNVLGVSTLLLLTCSHALPWLDVMEIWWRALECD